MSTSTSNLSAFRPWFYAAAVYNLTWGAVTVIWPYWYFDLVGIARPDPIALWQFTGMVLAIFAPGFWWAARRPEEHPHLILIALLGKLFGPIGFLWGWAVQDLPASFGWTMITNDLIWWPAFALYLHRSAKARGGWRPFLGGG